MAVNSVDCRRRLAALARRDTYLNRRDQHPLLDQVLARMDQGVRNTLAEAERQLRDTELQLNKELEETAGHLRKPAEQLAEGFSSVLENGIDAEGTTRLARTIEGRILWLYDRVRAHLEASLLIILLTAAILWLLHRISNVLANRFSRYRLLISGLYPVLRLFGWIAAVSYILFAIIRPPLNALFAVSASAGLAIGLGAQDLVRNIVAGLLILFERPFHVGT